jgi:hypothetical protein
MWWDEFLIISTKTKEEILNNINNLRLNLEQDWINVWTIDDENINYKLLDLSYWIISSNFNDIYDRDFNELDWDFF